MIYLLAAHPDQDEFKAFEEWLEKEGVAALKYRQHMETVACGCSVIKSTQRGTAVRKRQSAHEKRGARERTCPVCRGHHS